MNGIRNFDKEDRTMIIFHDPDRKYGFMSNWYKSDFYENGILFTSVEQYLMYWKAVIFGETQSMKAILDENDPAKIQKIGRLMTTYDEKVWSGFRSIVLYRGLLCKFSQNTELRRMLLDTGDRILAEGTASDVNFANGLARDNDGQYTLSKWLGKNLLGFALMAVRDELKK